ncbi:PB2 polymerase subunit [Sinu virus]|uniref:PB2 polymerase subunit n=1 Tax=Sinu virus TaxID=1927799 RepID=A0A1L5YKG2_9ORTO|nr:PB2 polymerase subunit [Sinu virus]APP91613.1 PB2 polymerase subunit [Sinu virus]
MDANYKTLLMHIKRYKGLEANNELFKKKHIKDYDIFKRYTSSTSESTPQQRLCYNMRKNWPITIERDENIPSEYKGFLLKDSIREIGNSTRTRGTVHVVDYWTKFGTKCDPELAKALISIELEKVERFFNQIPSDLIFGKFYPYRQSVNITPVVEHVHKGAVASTIICALLKDFASVENRTKQNKNAVNIIRDKIAKFVDSKTLMSLIHIARKMIVKENRWLPTTVEHSSYTAEIVHLISSQYHLMPVERVMDHNQVKFESMFQEMIKLSLTKNNPKSFLLENLNKILYAGTPIMNICKELYGGPATTIVRALSGGNVEEKTQIRDTIIEEIENDAVPVRNRIESRLGEMSYYYEFQSWKGEKSCFFSHRNTKGYFLMNNNEVKKIFLTSEKNDYLLDLVADIFYYCKAAEPGFFVDFDMWVDSNKRFEKWYEHHVVKNKGKEFMKKLGVTEAADMPIAINWCYGQRSRSKVNNIFKMETNVQPYSSNRYPVEVDNELRVIKRTPMFPVVLINPREMKMGRRDIVPAGVSFKDSSLFFLYQSPQVRLNMIAERVINSKEEAEKFVESIYSNEPNSTIDCLKTAFVEITPGIPWKRKLDEIYYEDGWSENPQKRFKAFFAGVAKVAQKRKLSNMETSERPFPKKLKLTTGQVIDSDMKSGLVVSTLNNIRVSGKNVTNKELYESEKYRSVGIYREAPPGLLVSSIKEGMEKKMEVFYLNLGNRFFKFEENVCKHEQDENVRKSINTLERQLEVTSSQKAALQMLRG